ncbi:hypothetical protein ACFWYW_19135 [Nonomuraea sp. NPDC059023]|uniref:hypothetical protein n=1 Tax=unclassified Nonomuraea TaxID=2593643 RepID=UPI0036BBEBFD
MLAGFVSGLLDQRAIPRRDAFAVSDDSCERTDAGLTEVLGEQMRRRPGHTAPQRRGRAGRRGGDRW